MKKKVLELLVAIASVALIAGLIWFVLNLFLNPAPTVGTAEVECHGQIETPLGNEIYVTENNQRTEKKRLIPEEIKDDIPMLPYDEHIVVRYNGDSQNGGFFFTIYNEDLTVYEDKKSFFTPLTEPGTYYLCIEVFWGTEKRNIGMEYYIGLTVDASG